MKVVLLTGPESAGKSSLCAALAQHFGAPVVGEYVREYIVQQQRNTCYADITPIARGQWRREQAARAQAPPLLLLDTNLLSNRLWSQTLFGRSPAWIDTALARTQYDAVFLLAPEGLPWRADGQRCQPALAQRQQFGQQLEQALQQLQQPYTPVTGSWAQRCTHITAAVQQML